MRKVGLLLVGVAITAILTMSVMAIDTVMPTEKEIGTVAIGTKETIYQSILDKLNDEYGTNVHFSKEKQIDVGSSGAIDLTPEEFEVRIRKAIELNLIANEKADQNIKKMNTDQKIYMTVKSSSNGEFIATGDYESGSCLVTASQEYDIVYPYQHTKYIEGAGIELNALVNLDRGFWAFSYVVSVAGVYPPGEFMDIRFHPGEVNCSYADSQRTCAIELYGRVFDPLTDVTIDLNARRYVEFWAGSGMPDPSTLVAE